MHFLPFGTALLPGSPPIKHLSRPKFARRPSARTSTKIRAGPPTRYVEQNGRTRSFFENGDYFATAEYREQRMSKTIVITGAGSGLGRAMARRLAQDEHRLLLLGRTLAKVEAV